MKQLLLKYGISQFWFRKIKNTDVQNLLEMTAHAECQVKMQVLNPRGINSTQLPQYPCKKFRTAIFGRELKEITGWIPAWLTISAIITGIQPYINANLSIKTIPESLATSMLPALNLFTGISAHTI